MWLGTAAGHQEAGSKPLLLSVESATPPGVGTPLGVPPFVGFCFVLSATATIAIEGLKSRTMMNSKQICCCISPIRSSPSKGNLLFSHPNHFIFPLIPHPNTTPLLPSIYPYFPFSPSNFRLFYLVADRILHRPHCVSFRQHSQRSKGSVSSSFVPNRGPRDRDQSHRSAAEW